MGEPQTIWRGQRAERAPGRRNLQVKPATFSLSSLANEGTHRALESNSGHISERRGDGELISQRLQQTALLGSAKDDC